MKNLQQNISKQLYSVYKTLYITTKWYLFKVCKFCLTSTINYVVHNRIQGKLDRCRMKHLTKIHHHFMIKILNIIRKCPYLIVGIYKKCIAISIFNED